MPAGIAASHEPSPARSASIPAERARHGSSARCPSAARSEAAPAPKGASHSRGHESQGTHLCAYLFIQVSVCFPGLASERSGTSTWCLRRRILRRKNKKTLGLQQVRLIEKEKPTNPPGEESTVLLSSGSPEFPSDKTVPGIFEFGKDLIVRKEHGKVRTAPTPRFASTQLEFILVCRPKPSSQGFAEPATGCEPFPGTAGASSPPFHPLLS